MNKKKKLPFGDPETDKPGYLCPSASQGDMTGLIPSGTDSDDELDSYEDVYPFAGGKL